MTSRNTGCAMYANSSCHMPVHTNGLLPTVDIVPKPALPVRVPSPGLQGTGTGSVPIRESRARTRTDSGLPSPYRDRLGTPESGFSQHGRRDFHYTFLLDENTFLLASFTSLLHNPRHPITILNHYNTRTGNHTTVQTVVY